MKQSQENQNRQAYVAPKAEIFEIELQGVLCDSATGGMRGNTEGVGISGFGWI